MPFISFSAANIKEEYKTKKYPGQTSRICDDQQPLCDELYISVTNDYLFIRFSISALTSLA
ncbi:hypothetical protein C3V43_01130 [Bacteroides heparinolyticus]|nr:hypothetical protein C3V43_01130 [Bacteroides heparinolyticus]